MKGRQPKRSTAATRTPEIGPYRLGDLLGRGGMGEVYRAFDDRLERWVAVKRLRDRRSSGPTTSDRLRREAKVLARLGHPAIVQIFDIVEADAQDWIVMELIEGPTLAELCRDQPVAIPLVIHYARQIASALGAAHDRGIVHRDLKTENVMALPSGHVKVLDFGIAQALPTTSRSEVVTHRGATVSLPGRIVGTPRSMSPEQALGAEIDARSDFFSLGVLLYEITTGRSPFTASTIEQMVQRILRHTPRSLHHAAADVPLGLSRLVDSLLEKDPALRPSSAEAIETALATLDVPDVAPESVTLGLSQLATLDDASWPEDTGSAAADTVVITTLLVTDLPDATSLVETLGDAEAAALFRRHDRAARDLLETHGGREIDRSDGFLLLFERPWTAIRYALDYHRCSEDLGLRARVGIHLGEVVLHQNTPHDIELGARPVEIDGLARPMANLLVGLADDGQTLLTRAAYDVTRRSAVDLDGEALEWREHGSYHVVGVGEPVDVFEIGVAGRAPLSPPADSERAWKLEPRPDDEAELVGVDDPTDGGKSRRPWVVVASVLVALVVIAAIVGSRSRSRPSGAVEPLAVAVIAPTIGAMHDDDTSRLFAFTVRNSARRALVDLDGIAVRGQNAVDTVDAGPRAVALAVAADEVLGIELACAGNECLIELSRSRGADGQLLASTQARAPRHRLLLAADAVHLAVRELFPDHPPLRREDAPDVDAETFDDYVDLLHRLTQRPDPAALTALLDEVAQLRRRAPDFPAAALLEAEAAMQSYYQRRDPALLERVRQALGAARRLDPDDPEPVFEQIQLAIEDGSLDAAEEQLALAAEMVPNDVRWLELRAELLEARGQSEQALALRAEVVDREPSWTRLYRHAVAAFDHGDAATARQRLQQLLDRFPGNRWAISLLAMIELESGDFERAADLYAILTEQSAAANDLTNLGVVQLIRRDFDDAIERFEQALALRSGNLGDLLNLADAHLLAGRRASAVERYHQVLAALAERSDLDWQDEMLRAQAHAHLGARQDAVAAIQRALRLAPPNNGKLAFEAALVYVVVGDHTAALVNAEAARQLGRSEHWFELPWFDPIRAELAATRVAGETSAVPGHSTSE